MSATTELGALDLSLSADGRELHERLARFLDERFFPVEREVEAQMDALDGPEPFPPLMLELREAARAEGLWNLFLADSEVGPGLSNVDYGHLCELLGRSLWAPMVFNCNFPDTGNMEVLLERCTPEQRERWLEPLLDGRIRSCFAMTEPDVASSDPTGIQTRARRDSDTRSGTGGWVIDGHKWFISGAVGAAVCVLMACTDPDAEPHLRGSMFLVPMDAPGLELVRRVPLLGHDGGPGHAELRFDGCRVPEDAVLGEVGQGFLIAQDRLGPGRIHHCMRAIGLAERAFELACERAATRPHRGSVLGRTQLVRETIAQSRIEIDAARLLVLRAARSIDLHGKRAAYRDISIAKVHAARMAQDVVDRSIQVHGALGLSDDVPLTRLWAVARALRIGDGADEVHLLTIGKHELMARHRAPAAHANGRS